MKVRAPLTRSMSGLLPSASPAIASPAIAGQRSYFVAPLIHVRFMDAIPIISPPPLLTHPPHPNPNHPHELFMPFSRSVAHPC